MTIGLRLEKAGYETWLDNEQLRGGDDWRATIDDAIKQAFAFIVIMTPEAKASEYVTYEWAFAWGAGVKVIPALLKPTPLHPRLEALQYLDFTGKVRPWDALIKVVEAAQKMPHKAGPTTTAQSIGTDAETIGDSQQSILMHRSEAPDLYLTVTFNGQDSIPVTFTPGQPYSDPIALTIRVHNNSAEPAFYAVMNISLDQGIQLLNDPGLEVYSGDGARLVVNDTDIPATHLRHNWGQPQGMPIFEGTNFLVSDEPIMFAIPAEFKHGVEYFLGWTVRAPYMPRKSQIMVLMLHNQTLLIRPLPGPE